MADKACNSGCQTLQSPRVAFKEYRVIADKRHGDRSLKYSGYSGESSTVSRVITKLIGMVNTVASPLQMGPGGDALQKDNREHPEQDGMPVSE